MQTRVRPRTKLLSLTAVASMALLAAGCGGDEESADQASATTQPAGEDADSATTAAESETTDPAPEPTEPAPEATEPPAATTVPAPTGDGGDESTVTIWSSVDQPVQDGLEQALTEKLAADGIAVNWQKVEDINKVVMDAIESNDTPDIAMIPQPGVVGDMVELGGGLPLDDVLDMDALRSTMVPGTLETGTIDGQLYGLLVSMNVKSLVFYNKPAWEAAGYTAPTTFAELDALAEQIKADGGTPWCMGIESGGATGWPATDWFEDLVMRYGDVEGYNQWVNHEIPFDSELVRQAAAQYEKIAFTEGNVLGGREAIASTFFGDAGVPMFDAAGPQCWLLKQGSFITGFFPDAIKEDLDTNVGLFGFPAAEAGGPNPVLGGGDLAVMLDDSDSTKLAMQALASVDIGQYAAPISSFLSPHKTFDVSLYPSQLAQDVAGVAYSASAFLFDASDLMPGEVGAGTFWTEMTSWVAGESDLDTALTNIDDSWPS